MDQSENKQDGPTLNRNDKGKGKAEFDTVNTEDSEDKRVATAAAAKPDPYSAEVLLTSSKSKLIDADLIKSIASPEWWANYSEADKAEIRPLIADFMPVGEDGMPTLEYLKYDVDWRDSVLALQSDLAAGRCEPEWQAQAKLAHEERDAGKFDAWKEQEFEEFWGQKQRIASGVLTGKARNIKLDTLIEHGLFKVGDIWSYARVFGSGNAAETVIVEKHVKIVAIEGADLTFGIPPGQLKYARIIPANPEEDTPMTGTSTQSPPAPHVSDGTTQIEDVMVATISSCTALENKILEIDGRMNGKTRSHGSAWRHFRVQRKEQDLGSLFEMREEYYVYKHPHEE